MADVHDRDIKDPRAWSHVLKRHTVNSRYLSFRIRDHA